MRCVGIRREDKDRWEARVPLVPRDVASLLSDRRLSVTVQPSAQRAFGDEEFSAAGARIDDDLSDREAVLGVKEMPVETFRQGVAYLFFSHTIKGQPYNMPMLRRMMERGAHLLDYERITDERGARLISFSRFAGIAGALDTLWALGRRLEWEGLRPNPFAQLRQTYTYGSVADAVEAAREAGARLRADGLPAALCPFVIGVAGYGRVSRGAQEVLAALGPTSLTPERLPDLANAPPDPYAAYQVVFEERHLVERKDPSAPFDLDEYYAHPELYRGTFARRLPFLSVLINSIYWEAAYPRLITIGDIRGLWETQSRPKLTVIGDITCDIDGSVELTVKETHLDEPVFVFDPAANTARDGVEGRGPVVFAVGNLPCELAREASEAFSGVLRSLLPGLTETDLRMPYERLALAPELKRALILHKGRLTPGYRYLKGHL